MKKISLLDCTLRDGGYINNWKFGNAAISDILQKLYEANVEIVEAGFIRNEAYSEDRTVFSSMQQVCERTKKLTDIASDTKLAVMAEIAHPIPLDMIEPAADNNVDIIRVIVWKSKRTEEGIYIDALQESYEYCKGIVEKGYKLCVQPNRTDQYSGDEFQNMIKMFAELSPMAIYVVDSWGTMYSNQVIHYLDMADKVLPENISLGFHGHNNMMQAFGTAEKIIDHDYDRNIILDASVCGIGRGAGNLNTELIARYLNHECGCNYDLDAFLYIYDKYIKQLKDEYTWGSSVPFFLSADFNANPNYASYFENNLSIMQTKKVFQAMTRDDAILYTDTLARQYQEKILNGDN